MPANGDPIAKIDREPCKWTPLDLFLVFLFLYLFWPIAASASLLWSGWYHFYYGSEMVKFATDESVIRQLRDPLGLLSPLAVEALPVLRQLAQQRLMLWTLLLALPFQAVTAPLIFWRLRGSRPEALGLTMKALGWNLLAGVLAWIVLTPLALGLHGLMWLLFSQWPGGVVQEHPLVLLGRQPLGSVEWVLLVISASVAAPVLEEIMFRGALQPFFIGERYGGAWAVGLALFLLLFTHGPRLVGAADSISVFAELLPILFVIVLIPVLLWLQQRRSPVAPGIFGTAVLFASIHPAWPSPVALLLLGVGLGWLAWRTGSLAGPILTHALFNGTSMVQLLLGG
jgi:membrane protease YdiL (CAAX protease family)